MKNDIWCEVNGYRYCVLCAEKDSVGYDSEDRVSQVKHEIFHSNEDLKKYRIE